MQSGAGRLGKTAQTLASSKPCWTNSRTNSKSCAKKMPVSSQAEREGAHVDSAALWCLIRRSRELRIATFKTFQYMVAGSNVAHQVHLLSGAQI